jgi:DNA-directed RNA polymerase specialized sigma24 family protein
MRFDCRLDVPFQQVLCDARAGNNRARESLYKQFGPPLRRVIARKLKSQRIEWATSPHDIFDAVLLRVWNDDAMYTFRSEEDFVKFVSRAIEREVSDVRRTLTAGCRDYRRMEPLFGDESRFASTANDPACGISQKEECDLLRSKLSAVNQIILEMRLAGKDWDAIGAECGLPADAARKRFERSIVLLRRSLADGIQTCQDR